MTETVSIGPQPDEAGLIYMVDFSLNQRQTEMQELARDFAENYVKPVSMEIDKVPDPQKAFPVDLFKSSFKIGLQNMCIPQRYGGLGLDCITHVIMFEELAAADIGFAISYQAHNVALAQMLNWGTEEQRETYTKPIVEGGLAVICAVEPNNGAAAALIDPNNAAFETQAIQHGDHWVLNGIKTYCLNAGTPLTKWIEVFARTDMTQAGLTANSQFLVWADTPGITVGKNYDKMGHRMSHTPTVEFKDVVLPGNQILGGKAGFTEDSVPDKVTTADNFLNVAAMCVGVARTIYSEALAFSQKRVTNGKPMIRHQAVALKLANMYIEIEACRAMLWKAAWFADTKLAHEKNPFAKSSIGTKVLCSDMLARISRDGLQIFGGYGYTKDTLIEKLYRDAKAPEIYEGANDSLRIAITQFIDWGL